MSSEAPIQQEVLDPVEVINHLDKVVSEWMEVYINEDEFSKLPEDEREIRLSVVNRISRTSEIILGAKPEVTHAPFFAQETGHSISDGEKGPVDMREYNHLRIFAENAGLYVTPWVTETRAVNGSDSFGTKKHRFGFDIGWSGLSARIADEKFKKQINQLADIGTVPNRFALLTR